MVSSVRRFRLPLFFIAIAVAPFVVNCVCVPPRVNRNGSTSCLSNSDCAANETCVARRCVPTSSGCSEGSTRSCFLGGDSKCQYGTETCINGSYRNCTRNDTGKEDEVCNGIDDDCDGQVDETFPELGKVCVDPAKRGPCAQGVYTKCENNRLTCESKAKPIPEGPSSGNCSDGIDNDCDGYVDDPDQDSCTRCTDGTKQECYSFGAGLRDPSIGEGPCKTGTRTCTNGSWSACVGEVIPAKEACGDKIDNDCNGKIDDGCEEKCDPPGTRAPCYSGPANTENKGLCVGGVKTCQDNGTWSTCIGEVLPVKEICDDKQDNDCNGVIDDCGGQECKPGETRPCYSGDAATKGVGTCKEGTQTCDAAGKWPTACVGEVLPVKEICDDKLDNNCNNKVDDCEVKEFVTASSDPSDTIKLWDSLTQKQISVFNGGHTDTVYVAKFSPDGAFLYTVSHDKQVIAWDVATAKVVWKKTSHTDAIHALAVDPKGKWLASGSADNTIRLWDPATGKDLGTLKGHTGAVYGLAASSSGDALVSGSADTTARIWNMTTTPPTSVQILKGHALEIFAVAFNPKGDRVATGSRDTSVILWNVATGGQVQTLSKHSKSVTAVAFSADGKWFASGASDEKIALWDVTAAQAKHLRDITKAGIRAVYSLAFHPFKHTLLAGNYDGSVILWDPNTAQALQTYTAHNSPVSSVNFRP